MRKKGDAVKILQPDPASRMASAGAHRGARKKSAPAAPVLVRLGKSSVRAAAARGPAAGAGPAGGAGMAGGEAVPGESECVHQILRDLRPRARVLAITSGKGGVGKTSIAVNLGLALAAAGRRVLLVDADLGLANVDLVLGMRPRVHLGHVLAGQLPIEAVVQDGPAGIRWIPGAAGLPAIGQLDERRREMLLEGLAALETQHDFLVLDTPPGIGQGVLHLARQADELLLVTTPEPTSMMDAYALLKAVAATGADSIGQVRLIVNMVTHRSDAEEVHRRIAEVARRFLGVGVDLLGYVFCDGHVGRAVRRQEPLLVGHPHSQAAWCIKRLAEAVLEGPAAAAGTRRFAFFRRLANLFAAG